MKEIRCLDGRHRITIPKKILDILGGTPKAFEISFVGDAIVLTPITVKCGVCGKYVDYSEIATILACDKCSKNILSPKEES